MATGILCLGLASTVIAQPPEPLAETTIGIEGTVTFTYDGPTLVEKRSDELSAILVRIADRRSELGGETTYELRFIAIRPGIYDLRDALDFGPGRSADDISPLPVRVASLLPEDHAGDLDEIAAPADPKLGGYRTLLKIAAFVWLMPLLWVIARRWARRPEPPVETIAAEPTLADQLRPLVEAALAGHITLDQQARLELLLLTHWRDRLELRNLRHADAIRRMRGHHEAGVLLQTVERWLHSPNKTAVAPDEISNVLAPYRTAAAVAEPGMGGEGIAEAVVATSGQRGGLGP